MVSLIQKCYCQLRFFRVYAVFIHNVFDLATPSPHHFQILLLATFFFQWGKNPKTVNKVKFKVYNWLQSKPASPTDYQICWLGLISLVPESPLLAISTGKNQNSFVHCHLPTFRFSINNLLDIIFMKKRENQHINIVYLFIYIYWKESDSMGKSSMGKF